MTSSHVKDCESKAKVIKKKELLNSINKSINTHILHLGAHTLLIQPLHETAYLNNPG